MLLSRGGTSHTEFVGARLQTLSYDLGKLYGQYLRFDYYQGSLPQTLTTIYYDKGLSTVWLDAWTQVQHDTTSVGGSRLIIGQMPVEALLAELDD